MARTTVGAVTVIALSDMEAAYPAGAVYPTLGDGVERFRSLLTSEGNLAMNFGAYLLRADGRTVLVDTGWGPENNGRLVAELGAAGVAPVDIDTVVFTHLHGDHTGWNFDRATGRPLFARARYLVPRGDWDHYSSADPQPASFVRDVIPLESAGCLDLIEGERVISASLVALPTPGHTPGHTSIAIASNGEKGLILGDAVISVIDTEEPDLPNGFEWDNGIARVTRRALLERLAGENAVVGASHFPAPGLGRFVLAGSKHTWQPL